MKNTIIHPTDFSNCANKALDYAIEIAKALNCKISIIHAVDFKELDSLEHNAQNILNDTLLLEKTAKRKLKELCLKVEGQQIKCETTVCSGEISSWLPEFTRQNNPKLIIMGTTGAGSLKNKLFGSNTYSIIKETNTPLLSVPEKAVLGKFNKITFLSDYRDKDISAINFTVEIASHFKSEIDVVHILDNEGSEKSNNQQLLQELQSKVEEKVAYKNINYLLLFGNNIEERLQSLTVESNTDLLVLIMRKQHFFERFFFGSLTEKMAHQSERPFLVFPIVE